MTSSRKALLIVHQATSNPGRVGQGLAARGYELDKRCPAIGDPLPETMDEHDVALIFGGPMSANDGSELPFIQQETDWIGTALDSGKPFLGICLGAQMLSRHLGGTVAPRPDGIVEVGYVPVTPTEAGREAGLFDDDTLCAYQWHREGFTLPSTAIHLAESDHYPNQAFQYGHNAFGIQFHPEVTRWMMHRWIVLAADRLNQPGAQPAKNQIEDRFIHDPKLQVWLDNFLDHFTSR